MRIHVLFFGQLRDVTGTSSVDVTVEGEAGAPPTVAGLLATLYRRWPDLRAWDGKVLVAVGLEYAGRETGLREGQEVAVMPPVQGG